MLELSDLSDQEKSRLMEEARSSLARKRPAFGVVLLTIGLGIPLLTIVSLMIVAPVFFTSTLPHRLLFALVIAISSGIAVILVSRYRSAVIEQEARELLRRGQSCFSDANLLYVEYFDSYRLRLTFIVDAAIVRVLREIFSGIFRNDIKPDMIYAYSAFILVLGALRVSAVLVR